MQVTRASPFTVFQYLFLLISDMNVFVNMSSKRNARLIQIQITFVFYLEEALSLYGDT